MDTAFASLCQWLAPEYAGLVQAVCIAVATLLLALVALGFGPLRGWLGLTPVSKSEDPRAGAWHGGLVGAWRLYRRHGRAGSAHDGGR
jgi:hypothetical protein